MRILVIKKSTLIRSAVLAALFVAAICITQFAAAAQPASAQYPTLKPVISFAAEGRQIALTVDTAFGDDYTEAILDVLKTEGVTATFFVMGAWVNEYPEKLTEIKMAGHEIASHSYSHTRYTELTPDEIAEDANAARQIIKDKTGQEPAMLRPPYGAYDSYTLETLAADGMTAVKWSVDARDWKREGVDSIVKNVMDYVRPGAILMFQNNVLDTPQAMAAIIADLKEQGYEFVTVGAALAAAAEGGVL